MTKPPWTTIIADETPEDAHLLKTILQKHCPQMHVKAAVSHLDEAIRLVSDHQANLVFSNISLGGGTACDLVGHLKNFNGRLILLSPNELDALRAFRLRAFDFLLKPITSELLMDVVKRLDEEVAQANSHADFADTGSADKKFGTILLKVAGQQHIVLINNIAHLQGDGNYTTVHLISGEKILVSKPLKHFEDILPAKLFYRSHQSHIINLNNIKSVLHGDSQCISLKNGEKIPLARRKRESFLAWLNRLALR